VRALGRPLPRREHIFAVARCAVYVAVGRKASKPSDQTRGQLTRGGASPTARHQGERHPPVTLIWRDESDTPD
jgi:hypothetical protein